MPLSWASCKNFVILHVFPLANTKRDFKNEQE